MAKKNAGAKALAPKRTRAPAASPAFPTDRATWANADAMSKELRYILWELMPAKFTAEQRVAFLNKVSEELSAPTIDTFPESETVEAAAQLASEAEKLRLALLRFNAHTFRAGPVFDELKVLPKYAGRLPPQLGDIKDLGGLLTLAHHTSVAITAFAQHYITQKQPSRQTKPKVQAAKSLVTRFVWAHNSAIGGTPKGEWFQQFAKQIGKDPAVQLSCGRDIVTEAITSVKAQLKARAALISPV